MSTRNQQGLPAQAGGFIQFILLLIIILFVMKYLNLSISEVTEWFKTTFADVLK